jgi:hypothetical protein
MENKTNYIYRLMATGMDYTDLNSIAEDMLDDVAQCYGDIRASKPHFFKTHNGYTAVMVLYDGRIIKRKIDVFKPINRTSTKKLVVDQSSKKLSAPLRLWEDEEEYEDYED